MAEHIIRSAAEVAKEVQDDIVKTRGMSLAEAARRIGKSPQNFYNMLTGRSRFSKRTAELLHAQFGYSVLCLTEGAGSLIDSSGNNLVLQSSSDTPAHVYKKYAEMDLSNETERRLYDLKVKLEDVYMSIAPSFATDEDPIILYARKCKISPEEFGFECKTSKEKELFKVYAFWAGLVKELIDPSRIAEILHYQPMLEPDSGLHMAP